jgi:hypothetical protein
MSRKGSSSTTTYTSQTTSTDQSANAAQGGVAAGAGATVNISSLDKDVALGALAAQQNTAVAALQTNQNVSGMALDTASRAVQSNAKVADIAISANRDVNLASLDTTSRLATTAINTVVGLGEVASRERIDTLNSTNLALQNAAGASDKFASLASAALERSQAPDSAVTKQLLWVIGGVAALAVLLLFGRSRKSA